jgi:3'(2'), 5'-bisphosphate nucleotidase
MLENTALINTISHIATLAGQEIMAVYTNTGSIAVSNKADDSPLTEADTRANKLICAELQRLTPAIPIVSEENPLAPFAQRQQWQEYWLIDPLDGTKEFVDRNGEFTVNIALIRGGAPVLGVVHAPVTGMSWLGVVGLGAWKRGENEALEHIKTRAFEGELAQSTLKVLASRRHGSPAQQSMLDRLATRFAQVEVVNIGSSLKFCMLAEGKADFYPRLAPTSEWDTAAAQAVLEAAGGKVMKTDFSTLGYNSKDARIDWRRVLEAEQA